MAARDPTGPGARVRCKFCHKDILARDMQYGYHRRKVHQKHCRLEFPDGRRVRATRHEDGRWYCPGCNRSYPGAPTGLQSHARLGECSRKNPLFLAESCQQSLTAVIPSSIRGPQGETVSKRSRVPGAEDEQQPKWQQPKEKLDKFTNLTPLNYQPCGDTVEAFLKTIQADRALKLAGIFAKHGITTRGRLDLLARNLPTAEDPRDDLWRDFNRDILQEHPPHVLEAIMDAFTRRATMLASR